jgi:hypothetical protein
MAHYCLGCVRLSHAPRLSSHHRRRSFLGAPRDPSRKKILVKHQSGSVWKILDYTESKDKANFPKLNGKLIVAKADKNGFYSTLAENDKKTDLTASERSEIRNLFLITEDSSGSFKAIQDIEGFPGSQVLVDESLLKGKNPVEPTVKKTVAKKPDPGKVTPPPPVQKPDVEPAVDTAPTSSTTPASTTATPSQDQGGNLIAGGILAGTALWLLSEIFG